jgi:succinoglycan biosynthesis transport protein ExoP
MTRDGESAWETLTAYARVVRRRAWVIALVALAIPIAAIGLSKLEDPVYEASADVLLNRENLAATLANVPDTLVGTDPVRFMQTQARLARTADVVETTLETTNPTFMTPGEFLASSGVATEPDSDLLVFSARSGVGEHAVALADAYARSYVGYRNALDTAPHRRALDAATKRIAALRRSGDTDSALYASLVETQQQLQTIVALKTNSATLVQPALGATQISPQTGKRAQLALVFGLFAGLALAFLLEASDRRLRSPRDIPDRLKLPILGRIPRATTPDRLPSVTDPSGALAEAYRILRMNVEFASESHNVRSILMTSAVAGEGKSTTAANLAVTLARAGRNIVLVDADFLRPSQADYFGAAERPGLLQVVTRETELSEALTRIGPPFDASEASRRGGARTARAGGGAPLTLTSPPERRRGHVHRSETPMSASTGVLRLLATEQAPLDTTEAMIGKELRELLERLEAGSDLVIVDAPPLGTSVTLGLASLVDRVVVVANAELLREETLDDLEHSLDELPGEKLGLVLTAVDRIPGQGYGYATLPEPTTLERLPLAGSNNRRV